MPDGRGKRKWGEKGRAGVSNDANEGLVPNDMREPAGPLSTKQCRQMHVKEPDAGFGAEQSKDIQRVVQREVQRAV